LLWLPESIRFLAVKGRRPDVIVRTLRLMRPGIAADASMRFVVGDEQAAGARAFRLPQLFAGRLALITPLLWVAYIGSSMAVFFLASWMPTLAEASGLDRATAALGAGMLSLGGAVGGLLLMRFVDRFGAIAVTVMPAIACPLVAALGMYQFAPAAFMQYMFLVGLFVIGGHNGLHSIAGLFYPSAIRSNGAGWAISVAKLGSIAGPWIGGLLLGAHLDLHSIFLIAALPPVLFVVCILPLGIQHRRLIAEAAAAPVGALGQQA
jgi:MFS transporter, AAHS family, 4-hydroxybenzoate transporter